MWFTFPPRYTNLFWLYTWRAASTLNMAVDSGIPFARTLTHTHTHHHHPKGVSRNPAAEYNRCSCSSNLPSGLQPSGRPGGIGLCSPLPFLWGTNLRVACVALVGLYGLLVGRFGLGSVAWTEPRLLGTATGQQAWQNARTELKTGLLVTERCGLATTHLDSLATTHLDSLATTYLDSLALSIEDPGTNPAAFFCFVLVYDDLRQTIPAPGTVAIATAAANSSRCAVPQQSLWPAGAFSYNCLFQGERRGGLTRQPVGPSVDTAIMTTVVVCCCFLTLTDPLRIQPWSQDRRNQTKSTGNRR